jgi:putative ABC transport system permease protein
MDGSQTSGADEHLQLNESSLWKGGRTDRLNPRAHEAVPEIRKLLLESKGLDGEKIAAAEKMAQEDMIGIPPAMPGYSTLGDLYLLAQKHGTISDGRIDPARRVLADVRTVSPGYIGTMRIPFLEGEDCKEAANTLDVLVNRSFANLYMGRSAAVGHTLENAAYSDFAMKGTIRGIVGDAREQGLNEPPMPTVYSCFSAPDPFPNYLVRTRGEPMQMADAVRRRIHELEPGRSVYAIMPLQAHLDESFSDNRLRTRLLSLFALTAVSLACIGLYGTLSYLGRLRQREVGVRLALGALRSQIIGRFLAQGLRAAAIGCAAGLVLAAGFTRFLTSMLYGVSAVDPATYIGVVVLILLVASIASLAPAVRAARVEPVKVLREE